MSMLPFTLIVAGLAVVLFLGALLFRSPYPSEAKPAVLFLLPSFLHLVVFVLSPLLFSLALSCCRWNFLSQSIAFVGLDHFRELAKDRGFWVALRNTLLFALNVPVTTLLALCVAEGLHRWGKGGRWLQAIFFLPNICLIASVAIVWRWIYNPELGLLNKALLFLGADRPIAWLTDTRLVLRCLPLPILSVMAMWIWMHVGVQSVIFRGGLSKIPPSFYEAAALDGATAVQAFVYVTLPLLKPVILFVTVTSVIASFQVFTAVYVMLGKAIMRTGAADVLVYRIYEEAWGAGSRVGMACAMSWVLFLLLLGTTVVQLKTMGAWKESS